ncbi:Meiotic nuclear division protein 1, partial [Rhizoclosmatium sp. JEL0117]
EERSDLLVRVKEAQARLSALKTELVQFKDCDPALIDAKEKAAVIARDAANRWTDNVFCLQSYCRDRFGMDAATFCRNFQIPEEFDHIA